ncbi:MAG: N-acetyltransferase [Bacteroidales bacterium]|nr:N-acetyltransferase [Bacteroidales bacterium]
MDNKITVIEVTTKKQFNAFLKFPYALFKDDKMWVPSLLMDERATFNKKKNPALEFCDYKIWLAYQDDKIVGRIVGMINNKANQIWQRSRVRFGWLDFINSDEVAKALLDAVAQWGKGRGMDKILGPMGFTDMDKEGMMIEGFDVDCPMACYYNPSYYPQVMDRLGYEKEVDWLQYEIIANQPIPEKVKRINELIKDKYNLRIVDNVSKKEITQRYGEKIFLTLNKAFKNLFGYVPLNEKQIQFYIKQYFPFLDKRLICFVVDENDDVVAFGVSMPSLSNALRKGKGKLFPFGWFHLLKALRNFENIDLYLNGVAPEWQNKGVHSLYYAEMNRRYIKLGAKTAIANPQLEDNQAAHIWEKYDSHVAIRRRAYIKDIN